MHSIDAVVQPYIDQHAALGAAMALLRGGEIVYLGGFGVTSVEEHGAQVTRRTLFAYGSICKNLCAVLTMRLVEAGLLNLNLPIVQYLPDLHFSNADYGKRITLRHLLSHTSGLPMGGKNWGPRDPDALRRFVYEQIPYYTFLSEPGVVHLYSNTVFCIVGHIAEAVTGKVYDDLIQEYVFDPLQMNCVTYDPAVAMTYPVALPHQRGPDGELHVIHRMAYNVSGNPSSFALGSVSDLANLAQMYLSQGSFRDQAFLTASSVAEMQRIQGSRHVDAALRPLGYNYLGYGLGFQIGQYRAMRVVGHGGMIQSYNCFFQLFPDARAGVVVLTNQCDEDLLWELVTSLYDHVLDQSRPGSVAFAKPAALATPLDGNQLQPYASAYMRIETADLATFVVVDEHLMLERQGSLLPLVPTGGAQFIAEISETYRLSVAFIHNEHGEILHVMIGGEPYHPIALERTLRPDVELWQSFEGLYKDPSNDNREDLLAVRLQEGTLLIAEGTHEVPCKAISNRSFLSELGLFEFEDTASDEAKILVRGKSVRNYPVDKNLYLEDRVIRYLIDVPVVPQHVN